jgi:hypothetical protein
MTSLTRPIINLEYRTPLEVFDIMCDRINDDIARRGLEAGDAAPATNEPVAVKPLEWFGGGTLKAGSVLGTYVIRHDGDEPEEWSWSMDGHYTRNFVGTEDEAKAAAQADYTARILSALAQPVAAKGE